ncbi:MAG: serine/threonine-protein kinase [Pirellulales bacterium]
MPSCQLIKSSVGNWELGAVLHERDGVSVCDAAPCGSSTQRARYVVKLLDRAAAVPDRLVRFTAEAAAGRSVCSPHVVSVLAVHCRRAPYYFAMPKLAGETLADLLARRRRTSVAFALHVARQVATGLEAINQAGLLHADVRPCNIFLARDAHATLIDLEHTRPIGQDADPTLRCVSGTVEYLSPESSCSRHRVDVRSDLYSLGVVLFEMLGGRTPFLGATPEDLVAAHASHEPTALRELTSSLPGDVCDFVHKLLHKQPLRRPQSAAEVIDTLARLEIAHLELRAA